VNTFIIEQKKLDPMSSFFLYLCSAVLCAITLNQVGANIGQASKVKSKRFKALAEFVVMFKVSKFNV